MVILLVQLMDVVVFLLFADHYRARVPAAVGADTTEPGDSFHL